MSCMRGKSFLVLLPLLNYCTLPHSLSFITRNCPKNECARKSFLSHKRVIKEIFYDSDKSFMTQKTFPKSVENSFKRINSEYIFVV